MTLIKTAFAGSIINLIVSILLIIFIFYIALKQNNFYRTLFNETGNSIMRKSTGLKIGILILILFSIFILEFIFILKSAKHQDNDMETPELEQINAYQWTIFSLFIILIGLGIWFYLKNRTTLANLT